MELEVTWNRTLRIWWSYFWRNLIAVIVAVIFGAIIGVVLGIAGVSPSTIRLIAAPVGVILGLVASIFPLYFILGKDFGEFRLVLLAKNSPVTPPVLAQPVANSSEAPSSGMPPA